MYKGVLCGTVKLYANFRTVNNSGVPKVLPKDGLYFHQNLQQAVLELALFGSTTSGTNGISSTSSSIGIFNFCSKKGGFEVKQSARARMLSTSMPVTTDEFHSREVEEGNNLLMVTLPV